MATPMTADQFLRQLQKWGVPYRETSGWRTRNRNAVGSWGPVYGAGLHHTGDDAPDTADEKVLTQGRSDLPGPLCHWGTDDDGVVVLIGWGRANHFGSGARAVLDAVLDEDYGDYPPKPGVDSVDGNQHFYGQETMYSGLHEMTAAAYRSTVLTFAAVCDFHGWSAKSCIGHKEWTRRKIDPGHLDMAAFRRDIDAALEAGPGNWPTSKPTPAPSVEETKEPEMILIQKSDGDGGTFVYGGSSAPTYVGIGAITGAISGGGVPTIRLTTAQVDSLTSYHSATDRAALQGTSNSLAAIQATVAALAARPQVDTQQLAAALAPLIDDDLDATELAQHIVAALPDDLAGQVLDGLHDRLGRTA